MRNRKRQRENRKLKEELLSMKNNVGIADPTPYYAVLNMRNGNFYAQNQKQPDRKRETA